MISVCQLSLITTASSECMPRLLGIVAARRKFLAAGYPQAEYRPSANLVLAGALGRKLATLSAGEVAGDGEPQTRTPALPGAGLLGPVETVEDAWQVLWRNPGPRILHARLCKAVGSTSANCHPATFGRVANSVVK